MPLAIVLVLALVVRDLDQRETLPFSQDIPLPHRISVSWADEVAHFSQRLQQGFDLDSERANQFSRWILEASHRQHVSPELIASLVYVESSFRVNVRSSVGAIGPAQVRPDIWNDFCGGINLDDPANNIQCGAQILGHFYGDCGQFQCALQMYNVGQANLRRSIEYQDAGQRYVSKVAKFRNRIPNLF